MDQKAGSRANTLSPLPPRCCVHTCTGFHLRVRRYVWDTLIVCVACNLGALTRFGVAAGFDGTKHMSDMYALSLSTWRWRPITYYSDVPSFSTYGACCSTSTTTITLVSGSHIGAGDRLSVFVFDLDTHKWAKGAATGKPPSARSYYTVGRTSTKIVATFRN